MKIYELQHHEYVQNTNRSLERIAKKKKKYLHSHFQMNDNLYILQCVPRTTKWQNNKPLCCSSTVSKAHCT